MNAKIKKDRENTMITLAKNVVDQITVQPVVDIFLLPWVSLCVFSQFVISSSDCSSHPWDSVQSHSRSKWRKKRKVNEEILSWCEWISSFDYFPSQSFASFIKHAVDTVRLFFWFYLVCCMQNMVWLPVYSHTIFTCYNVGSSAVAVVAVVHIVAILFSFLLPRSIVTIFKQTYTI